MKIFALCSAVLLLIVVASSVCGLEVTDSLGRTVVFEAPPDRIVVAGRASLMIIDALYMFPEASEKIVALEEITQGKRGFLRLVDRRFEEKRVLAAVAGAEEVIAARPDVVLMKSFMRSKLSGPLESLGMKVLYYDLETPSNYFDDLRSLGALLGNEERAETIISYYRERITLVESSVETLPQRNRPKALLLYYSERGGATSFNVPPSSWMQTILVEKAGGIPVWKGSITGTGWMKLGIEQIAAWDPDFIFVTSYFSSSEEAVEALRRDPLWKHIGAVRKGQLYAFPSDYYSWDQPDPRWLLGLIWMGKTLHPSRLQHIDIVNEAEQFYRVLYSIKPEEFRSSIQPMMEGDLTG